MERNVQKLRRHPVNQTTSEINRNYNFQSFINFGKPRKPEEVIFYYCKQNNGETQDHNNQFIKNTQCKFMHVYKSHQLNSHFEVQQYFSSG